MGVDVLCHAVDKRSRRFNTHGHIGQHMLYRLEGDDRLFELLALFGVDDRLI